MYNYHLYNYDTLRKGQFLIFKNNILILSSKTL
jgi:hypothetical protein